MKVCLYIESITYKDFNLTDGLCRGRDGHR
jgi:hypothetical protein